MKLSNGLTLPQTRLLLATRGAYKKPMRTVMGDSGLDQSEFDRERLALAIYGYITFDTHGVQLMALTPAGASAVNSFIMIRGGDYKVRIYQIA